MGNFFSSMINLVGADSGLGKPVNVSFLSVIGEFFYSCLVGLLDIIMWGIYSIVRFVLNIVDFLQFFVKKLMGLDYWGKGTASVDTLGESDVIFRFLSNENVIQVFKYMIGIFLILLIVFTIIAIVKTEYAYASSSADSNSKGSILNRALKACMLVVLLPIIIIMGILASNAILTSLVNAFNINNNLTLGGQVFTASAYDANKYRLYANNNIRLGATTNVAVTAYNNENKQETVLIPASLTPIIPMKYKSDSKFTGYYFIYEGTEYLYYVEPEELEKHYNHYKQYLTNIGATIRTAASLGVSRALTDDNYAISVALHPLDSDDSLIKAAYNTWNYNELLTKDTLTFDKTVTYTDQTFTADSNHSFQARKYSNSTNWGNFYDGGTNGLVVLPDEYKVMADIIDFMISDVAEMSFVNISNPLIDWVYGGTGTYLNSRYVKGISASGYPSSFMVNYAEAGNTLYVPNRTATSEETGAIYIMAYYNSADGTYVPVVHNKTYVDDAGNKHTFKSSSLDTKYEGLIVARGVLDSTFTNRVGQPTQITTNYNDETGSAVGIDTPYYVTTTGKRVFSWASEGSTVTASLSNTFDGFDRTDSVSGNLTQEYASGITQLSGKDSSQITTAAYETQLNKIAESLPTGLVFSSLTADGSVQNTNYTNLSWKYNSTPAVTISNKTYLVYYAQSGANALKVEAHVDNKVFSDSGSGNTYNTAYSVEAVPLFALVEVSGTSVNTLFAYGQGSSVDMLTKADTVSLFQSGDGIYGNTKYLGVDHNETLLARLLTIGDVQFVTPEQAAKQLEDAASSATTRPLTVVAKVGEKFTYNAQMETLGAEGSGLENTETFTTLNAKTSVVFTKNEVVNGTHPIETQEMYYSYSSVARNILLLEPTITGDILNGTVVVDGVTRTGEFVENPGTRATGSGYTDYFFSWTNGSNSLVNDTEVNVRVRVSNGGAVRLLIYDTYKLNVTDYYGSGDNTFKIGGSTFEVSAYNMEYVKREGSIETYRYEFNNQYFYFSFKYSDSTNGKLTPLGILDSGCQVMYKVTINYYNLFTYRDGDTVHIYDPTTKNTSAADSGDILKTSSYYLRESSIEFGNPVGETSDNAGNIYNGTLYAEDNDDSVTRKGSIIASFNVTMELGQYPTSDIEDSINRISSISSVDGSYSRVPNYAGVAGKTASEFAKDVYGELQPHIRFNRHAFTKGCIRFDFSLNPLGLFGEGNLWRFKLSFLEGVSKVEDKTLSFTITNGRLFLDYNFNSVKHLTLNTFFMPGQLNVVVLVFAAILLFSVLGQAVWGLIARIYDIVLYFIIMPAVVSTTVIQSDSKIYNNWQSNLISKVMSAYGVLIGINFFFLLIPAIKDASQLFTAHDLATNLSQGSWVSKMPADAINNLVYILFLLVAFTIIKTLPSTIGNLIGLKKGDEVYSAGASVKKSVDTVVKEVSHHTSGRSLMDLPGKTAGMIKNFTPGSAVYDEWRKKHPRKSRAERRAEEEQQEAQRGAELARQQAAAAQERARQQMGDGDTARNAAAQNSQEANQSQETQTTTDTNTTQTQTTTTDTNTTQTQTTATDTNAAAETARNIVDGATTGAENAGAAESSAEATAGAGNTGTNAQNANANAQNAGDSSNTNAAASYAAAAASSAAAAQAYADIASGNTAGYAKEADAQAEAQKQAEKEQKAADKQAAREQKAAERAAKRAEKSSETRDERRLRELKEELAAAESDTSVLRKRKAYAQFNAGKSDLTEQILDVESNEFKQAVVDRWNATHGKDDQLTVELAEKLKGTNKATFNAYKDEVIEQIKVDQWNKKHADNKISTADLTDAKLRRAVNNEFKDNQAILQATAKNEFITGKIQEKINKQETKMRLKEEGLYQNVLQKALSKNQILHRTTDADRIKLAGKRDAAKEELKFAQERVQEIKNEGQKIVNENKELQTEIDKKRKEVETLYDKYNNGGLRAKDKTNALLDARRAEKELAKLEQVKNGNEQVLLDKARQLTEAENTITDAKSRIAKYEQALDGNYQGVLAGLARRTANGGRFIKAGTHLAAQRMAEAAAEKAQKSYDKKEAKMKSSEHSDNDKEKFTDRQIKALDRKKGSVDSSNTALSTYASTHGFDISKFKDSKNITKDDMKRAMDDHMNKQLARNGYSEEKVIRAQYAEMQKDIDKLFAQKDNAQAAYDRTKREFNRVNHNSFVRRDNKLGRKQVAAAELAKSRLISEMNDKNRKGLLTNEEEQDYIRKIHSHDQAIADAQARKVAYHKIRKNLNDTAIGRKFLSARASTNAAVGAVKNWTANAAVATKGWVGGKAAAVKAWAKDEADLAKYMAKDLKDTVTNTAAYKAARYLASQGSFYTKLAASAMKEKALDFRDATYGRYKRAKNVKAYMASDEHAADRQSYIAKNAARLERIQNKTVDDAIQQRLKGQSILQRQLDKQYINRIKSDLAKNGLVRTIDKVKTVANADKYAMKLAPNQKTMDRAIQTALNRQMNGIVDQVSKATKKVNRPQDYKLANDTSLNEALARSKAFHSELKRVEAKLKKDLKSATKVDAAKGIADELSKVQYQIKSLKNLEERTKRQVSRLNSTINKINRDKKSEKYKIKGLDKGSDAKK